MPHFPNDQNGQILHQMYNAGDNIAQPRMIDFCFVFVKREQALAFIKDVDNRNVETCLSWYQAKEMWQVVARQYMVPEYTEITAIELSLAAKAHNIGGEADGWGCMQILPGQGNY